MTNRVSEFILTRKWHNRIVSWAKSNGSFMREEEAVQEARLIEWEISKKLNQPQFENPKYCENYFLKSVKRKIYQYGKTSWWDTKRIANELPSLDIIDSLIELRSFDDIGWERWMSHLSFIIAEIDAVSAELFHIRITTNKRWTAIRKDYSHFGHHRFWGHVRTIKDVVKQELCKK